MLKIGCTSAVSTAAIATDTARNSMTALPMTAPALRSSWAPTARPMPTVTPMASPTSMTVIMCMIWLPMDTAVMLAVPSNWPMMNRSAMPYSVCKKYDSR